LKPLGRTSENTSPDQHKRSGLDHLGRSLGDHAPVDHGPSWTLAWGGAGSEALWLWQIRLVVLAFGDGLELDTAQFELRRVGRAVPLEPQAFDVLTYLVSHRDRVVSKEELMDAVWGGRFVAETAVTSRIKQVRRALGDDGQTQGLVRTVHGRGYRFVAPVQDRDVVGPAAPRPSSGAQAPIRYTVSDGLHVAYQVTGGGDRDIVLIPGFISHLEQDWGDPRHAHFLDRLGTFGRLIRFDKRGTGCPTARRVCRILRRGCTTSWL
jgi:DNA-binding winged helix-turn-helix (wHTH) protein